MKSTKDFSDQENGTGSDQGQSSKLHGQPKKGSPSPRSVAEAMDQIGGWAPTEQGVEFFIKALPRVKQAIGIQRYLDVLSQVRSSRRLCDLLDEASRVVFDEALQGPYRGEKASGILLDMFEDLDRLYMAEMEQLTRLQLELTAYHDPNSRETKQGFAHQTSESEDVATQMIRKALKGDDSFIPKERAERLRAQRAKGDAPSKP